MSGRPDDDFTPQPDSLVKAGRGAKFTDVGEWVVIARVWDEEKEQFVQIDDRSCRVYWILRAHVRHDQLDDNRAGVAFPTQEDMAEMMGLAKYDSIGKAIKRLVSIGAIDVDKQRHPRNPMRQRNVYTVHREPPEGYDGPLSTSQWYRHSNRVSAGQPDTPNQG